MKKRTIILGILLSAILTGCQENPDSSIVVNKDMDKLIEQAQETGAGMDGVSGGAETYQTEFEDTSLQVYVKADARVDIPETDRMSVFRVEKTPIRQEFLDKVIDVLIGDEPLYDGGILSARTKSDILSEIQVTKNDLAAIDEGAGEDQEIYRQEYESILADLQAQYEKAPDRIAFEGNESSGVIQTVEDMKNTYPDNEFYVWEYDLNPEGDIFYAVTDGQDGMYTSITVQNNENYGNYLRYRKSRHGYEFTSSAYVQLSGLDGDGGTIWPAGTEWAEAYLIDGEVTEYTDEPTTISEGEALAIADNFMKTAGLNDVFKYDGGGLYNEILDIRKGDNATAYGYRKEWILRYSRMIDNVFVTFESTAKYEEGWKGNEYVKRAWPIECIEIRITDDGIVGLDYNAPLEITETVVEDSNMKSYDEIRTTFEKMVVVANAEEQERIAEGSRGTEVTVDAVVLGYTRISEANSYDTGLLVPVWDFMGTVTDSYGITNHGSVLAVNAIDGSVIDRSIGY